MANYRCRGDLELNRCYYYFIIIGKRGFTHAPHPRWRDEAIDVKAYCRPEDGTVRLSNEVEYCARTVPVSARYQPTRHHVMFVVSLVL